MRKIIVLIMAVIIAGLCCYFWQGIGQIKDREKIPLQTKDSQFMENISGKKAVIIIASENFRDEEYFGSREVLENRGIELKTASNKAGIAKGTEGGEVKIDLLVSDIKAADFDAVVFIGGPGALQNLDNEFSYDLVRSAIEQKKIVAAICIAPVILAKAGALKGKEATVWSSPSDRSPIEILGRNGAKYVDKDVVADGKMITANGPSAAGSFGEKIAEALME